MLPTVKTSEEGEEITVKSETRKIWSIITDLKYIYFIIYLYFPGVTIGFYATFLSNLVQHSIPQEAGQSDADYEDRINYLKGYVFIVLGVSQALTGLVMNQWFEKYCKFKLAIIGTGVVEAAAFISFLCYYL